MHHSIDTVLTGIFCGGCHDRDQHRGTDRARNLPHCVVHSRPVRDEMGRKLIKCSRGNRHHDHATPNMRPTFTRATKVNELWESIVAYNSVVPLTSVKPPTANQRAP